MLALGLVALAVLRAPWWLHVLGVGAVSHLVVLAASAGDDGRSVSPALLPSSWPLLAVVVAAVAAPLREEGPRRPLPPVGHAVVGACVLAVGVAGPVGWFFATLAFFGEEPSPGDYRDAVGIAVGSAVLLAAGAVLVRVRWRTWSAAVPAAVGLVVQAGVVATCLPSAHRWPALHAAYVEGAALVPTSWPLAALLVVAVVTGAPGRRPGRVGPWSPDAVRSPSSA
ncbi:hypothetical protein G5V58_00880 [Nocardioides anomalus]|uniref:Uncharacterized protein n=1 Tax=Nocardioides anomalus TaxID=2712223 RepID=A0A6G6W8N4_9ACTN|nr:hypothetical protein [Nocardioides anomalus]QIG41513.1 hypothetical protein G5V58_00880 [Nocardioides anomalus]